MSRYTLITLAAAALFLIGEAHALTLTNRDGSQQRLEISEGGEELSRRVVIEPDQTIDGLCTTECTLVLENGDEMTFEVGEDVYIEDGRFVVTE